jgi:mono/diheme cytochrome c family protein
MLKLKFITIGMIGVLFWQCSVNQRAYNIPPELSKADKKELLSIIKHGIKMYKINCQQCHGSKYHSNDQGANFTEEQIRSYQVFMKIRNETHGFTQKMNSDDLDAIIIYLKYRKTP